MTLVTTRQRLSALSGRQNQGLLDSSLAHHLPVAPGKASWR